jgi:hypothetical protein
MLWTEMVWLRIGTRYCWELWNGCITSGLSSGTQLHRVSYILARSYRKLTWAFIYVASIPQKMTFSVGVCY